MDDTRRGYVSSDGISWQYTIEHTQQQDGIAWRAHIWQDNAYRGVLEGRVSTTEEGDPDSIANVALKMALDATYLRDFAQDADEAPAESAAPADDPPVADEPSVTDESGITDESGAADGLADPDPMPAPA
jgi:hypothetical protein